MRAGISNSLTRQKYLPESPLLAPIPDHFSSSSSLFLEIKAKLSTGVKKNLPEVKSYDLTNRQDKKSIIMF